MVVRRDFGFRPDGKPIDFMAIINNVLETAPKLHPIDLKFFLTDLYDRASGICPAEKAAGRPFSSVAMHSAENFIGNGTMEDVLTDYVTGNYKEIWGLSLKDLLSMPHWKVRMIREVTPRVLELKAKDLSDQLKKMNSKTE